MHDLYPGAGPDDKSELYGAAKVNEIVYRGMTQLFDRHHPGNMIDPDSVLGQDVLDRLSAMSSRGIGLRRLVIVSSLAHINHCKTTEIEAIESMEELEALMEEAPGA